MEVADALPEGYAERPMAPLFRVHEATLRNGLRVRIVPSDETPVVSLYTFFNVGSRNERPGLTGISHLFEHMMFNGAKKYGANQFDEVLESHGGRSNAYTTHDRTVYYEEFAAEALEQVLDLESDRMRSLAISERMLEREREVVMEERRLRVDNEVMGLIDEELQSLVFQAHPYRWPVIGWMGDIEAIQREDCETYFRTYYAPSNAVLWIAGNVDPVTTVRQVRRAYGDIPRGPSVPKVVNAEPPQRGERRSVLSHPAQAPGLLVAYRGPQVTHPDALTLDVLEFILSVGEGSRLSRRLVYEEKVAVDVGMDWSWRVDPGVLLFHAELAPDGDPARVEASRTGNLPGSPRKALPNGSSPRRKTTCAHTSCVSSPPVRGGRTPLETTRATSVHGGKACAFLTATGPWRPPQCRPQPRGTWCPRSARW